jgi:hypothetical protein
MYVIAVPSVPKKTAEFSTADEVINSLLDVRPENWGLPPFNDWIEGTLPIEPWFIGGPVIKGFGRGSKVLGIPTANLPAENFSDVVSEHTSGVYFGWAGLSTRGVYKMVMSIGWNPYFDNTEKTVVSVLHAVISMFSSITFVVNVIHLRNLGCSMTSVKTSMMRSCALPLLAT